MKHIVILSMVICLLFSVTDSYAQGADVNPNSFESLFERVASTNSDAGLLRRISGECAWTEFVDKMEDKGISLSLIYTQIYQTNLRAGVAVNNAGVAGGVHRRKGRFTGNWEFLMSFDTGKLFGLPGGQLNVLAEGGYSLGPGPSAVGSIMNVNASARGDRSITIPEFYYEHQFLDGKLRFRLGKMDITGGFSYKHAYLAFDNNNCANDETTQFLNYSFLVNPSIPFPYRGLAAAVYAMPVEGWYIGGGIADPNAVEKEMGFKTAFKNGDTFCVFETGFAPEFKTSRGTLPGTYRFGVWYDTTEKTFFKTGKKRSYDSGFYMSFDQVLYRENPNDKDDTQGLTGFFRYGLADPRVRDIREFYSGGFQYQGLLPRRDEDVFAVGYACSRAGFNSEFTKSHETLVEIYYSAKINSWLTVTPSIQFFKNPGMTDTKDTTVLGVRLNLKF